MNTAYLQNLFCTICTNAGDFMQKASTFSKIEIRFTGQDVSKKQNLDNIAETLAQISSSLGQLVDNKRSMATSEIGDANAYHWDAHKEQLIAVENVSRIPLELLQGIEHLSVQLMQNTLQFTRGHAANNALLWGARGMGKSSLVKALHAHICQMNAPDLKRLILVEIDREDITSLPVLMRIISTLDAQFIIYCDDLSFDEGEASYKSLKTILDGGLEGRPQNTLFYATSNRRHLMPRNMIENERTTAINPSEAVHEKISLSDRFGLWLGFHNCSQEEYLAMVKGYADFYKIKITPETLKARAIEWAATRGSRSGRVAMQFIRQIAGEKGQTLV